MSQPATTPSKFIASHPDYANDSASLASLYSSLGSLRISNPTAYASNVQWWKKTLDDISWAGAQPSGKGKAREQQSIVKDRLVLHLDEALVDAFTLDDVGRPMGIATAVLDLSSGSHLLPLHTYLTSSTPFAGPSTRPANGSGSTLSVRSVAGFLLGKPLYFALGALGLTGGGGDEEEDELREWKLAKGSWVSWHNVETAANAILSTHFDECSLSPLDALHTLTSFKDLVQHTFPHLTSETDTRVLLKYLCRDRRLAIEQDGVVKLARSETDSDSVSQLTEQDKGLIAIKETRSKLDKQVQQVEERIKEREAALAQSIKAKQPQSISLRLLRSKRELVSLLEKRLDSKAQLDTILLQIEQSASDIEVVRAYEASTGVLRSLTKQSGGVQRVEEVMRNLEDAMADQAEIDGVMREGNDAVRRAARGGEEAVDEADEEKELELEMARLEEEEKRERAEREERERKEEEERQQRRKREEAEEAARKEREEREERRIQEESRRRQEHQEAATASAAQRRSPTTASSEEQQRPGTAKERAQGAVAVVED